MDSGYWDQYINGQYQEFDVVFTQKSTGAWVKTTVTARNYGEAKALAESQFHDYSNMMVTPKGGNRT